MTAKELGVCVEAGELALLEALPRAIFDSPDSLALATDETGLIRIFGVGAERLLGYAAADVVNKLTPADLSDPLEVVARATALSAELATPITSGFEALVCKASRGAKDVYELTYVRKDGSRLPAVVSVTALRGAQRAIIGYLLTGAVDTPRARAQAAPVDVGEFQRAILNSAIFSKIATDVRGVIQSFNAGAERMLGYAAVDVINTKTPADLADPLEVSARAKALSAELGTPIKPGFEALVCKASRGIDDVFELTYIRKDGGRFGAVVSVTALRDVEGAIIGYLLSCTDNTVRRQVEEERKKLDQRLRDQQFYTRSLIESSIDALMTTDPDGFISDVNKQMEALTGCTRDELIGAPFKNYFTDPERAEAGIKRVLSERMVTDYELTARARDGKETVVSYNATTFYDRDRVLQGVFAAARDITERKRLSQALQDKNAQLERAKTLEEKAEQLALASRYKSQFLANMSHELRTPLNSLLLLARILGENADRNLTGKQLEFVRTIYAAGNDLLSLINDILDLSKIESGTMALEVDEIEFTDLRGYIERTFRQMALERGLRFDIALEPGLPRAMSADSKRLQQVLRNLLSNALKFTPKGEVSLSVGVAKDGWRRGHPVLDAARTVLRFRVTDSGIGIPANKQETIFEAFQQGDMTTSRRFGGTGLGLSISREIAHMLGGEIRLESVPGKGSVFTLFVPAEGVGARAPAVRVPVAAPPVAVSEEESLALTTENAIGDDRDVLNESDSVVLIIEDDVPTARVMLEAARAAGFKGLAATRGDVGMALVGKFKPDAIALDLRLPDCDGWSILHSLKASPLTRQIVVQVVSADVDTEAARREGAFGHVVKPMTREAIADALGRVKDYLEQPIRRVLVVEDNELERAEAMAILAGPDVRAVAVGNGAEGLAALRAGAFDCVVLDMNLPDMTGHRFLARARDELGLRELPFIIHTAKDLSGTESAKLQAQTILVKDPRHPERLLDAASLILHRQEVSLSEAKRLMLEERRSDNAGLAGKKVLVVDDDLRNIFAMTSALEHYHLDVVHAENGMDALELLRKSVDIDLVLMDIMMPGMDGYETMREVRKIRRYRALPIVAVTAQAMKGDGERCIAAGASDYIPKPVELDHLLARLRAWLWRPRPIEPNKRRSSGRGDHRPEAQPDTR